LGDEGMASMPWQSNGRPMAVAVLRTYNEFSRLNRTIVMPFRHALCLFLLTAIGLAAQTSAQPTAVLFTVCAQSTSWTRPSPDVQSKIWSDNRFKEPGAEAYEWAHNFLPMEPDSASLAYDSQNLSGLWTELPQSQCPRRDEERDEWSEIWALNYYVTRITLDGLVYTVTVEPRKTGYEIIQFRRPSSLVAALTTLRFVDEGGTILDQWREISPSGFAPASRSR
jgi:hypothetical protein